ncbi:ASCH domain-containing protein [Vibrio sp. FNV 38]|nr:ASCH domain-containing protein [Vibrio sp. FNV 38]
MEETAQTYLNRYLASLNAQDTARYISFSCDYFCADQYNADLCASLIKQGVKTATCSLAHWYQAEGESMPTVGHLQVVTDWQGQPHCIIEITHVELCRYCDVTDEFAALEGEGDKTLGWWREAHWAFFSQECDGLGIKPDQTMMLVLERFKVVYCEG